MKFSTTAAIAVVAILSLCEARDLCGDGPEATPTLTPATTTAAPLPTTTPPPTTPTPTEAPSTTPAPTSNFYVNTSPYPDMIVVNPYTADEIPLGQCVTLGCWRQVVSYKWDVFGPQDTTVSFFTSDECNPDALAIQYPVDAAGSVPQAAANTYQSFVILPNTDVPTDSTITSKRFMCKEK